MKKFLCIKLFQNPMPCVLQNRKIHPTILCLLYLANGNMKSYVGIEIGGTKLQIVVANAAGKIVQHRRYAVADGSDAKVIRQQIETAILELNFTSIAAVGVGFGGPVNWQTGVVEMSHQVAGWDNFALRDWLQQLTGASVLIDNDANVAALAEACVGAGKQHEIVFYMTIGSGIGGGLVVSKKVYHGAVPGEVEIGHVRLNKSGETLESACSGWAVNKKVRAVIKANPQSLLASLAKNYSGPEAALLKDALQQNDAKTQEILAAIVDDLAFALSHVVHLFHPHVIVIGGGLSLLGEVLRDAVATALPRYIMTAFLPPPVVALAALGEDVVPVGAVQLAQKIDLTLQNL